MPSTEHTPPPTAPAASSAPSAARAHLKLPVFIPSVIIIALALIAATWVGATYGEEATETFTAIRDGIGSTIGWWYVLVVTACLVFCFIVAFSRVGRIRLGRDDERPEFSLWSWFAMLFSAGMGIGLVFSGVSEPLSHYMNPPEILGLTPGEAGADTDGSTQPTADRAVGLALFHWGLHAWGIYAVVGLGLAYMTFRHGRPLSVRWLLEPLFGRRLIESWVGHLIDMVAVVGTVFGLATSLGLGILQIEAGFGHLGWFQPTSTLTLVLVVGITALGTLSAISGVDKGIRILSNTNMGLATALAIATLLLGPTVFILRSLVQNAGEYIQVIPQLAFVTGAGADDGWTLGWTLFNQAWFLSWAPFVGMFIARISRGRSIREFLLGVLLAPTLVSLVWFTVFGSSGLLYQLRDGSLVGGDGTVDSNTVLFQFFAELPVPAILSTLLSIVAIIVIMLFFITSSDSAAMVVDVLGHGGQAETPRWTRAFWAIMMGLAGAVLLLVGGDAALNVLQVSSLAAAAPLSIVYLLAMVALWRMLRYESAVMPRYVRFSTPTSQTGEVPQQAESTSAQRSLRELARDQERAESGRSPSTRGTQRPSFSATYAGLGGGTGRGAAPAPTDPTPVVAIHDVAPEAVQIDESDGSLTLDDEHAPEDPIGGEVFDTPEFEASAAGAAQRD